jgi:hypothetical protein
MPAKPKKSHAKARIRTAPVQDLIIKAIADDYPTVLHDRDSFLRSRALKKAVRGTPDAAVKKSLSRAKHGAIPEILVLGRNHERVMLPEIGMVAISVSISSLNAEREDWKDGAGKAWWAWKKSRSGPEPHPSEPEPTQEVILRRIINSAREWIDEELLPNKSSPGLQLLILDASIVHGSSSFDMLLTVLYHELAHFTRFVREVVQRAKHVNSSQTLQIPFRIGFPKLQEDIEA